jgi:hypothetical protein
MKKLVTRHRQKRFIKLLCSAGSSFSNWMKVLTLARFKVGHRYIGDVIIITAITIFLTPFRWLERIVYNGRIKKTEVKSPVFIIGHMRSGTTFMHYMFSQDERFTYATTTEAIFPWVFITLDKSIKRFVRFVLPPTRPMDSMKMGEHMPQEEEFAIANLCPYSPYNGAYFPKNIVDGYIKYSFFEGVPEKIFNRWKKMYTYYLQKLTFTSGNKRILSKSLVNSGRIKFLIKMFPDAKFVFIYRDPYKVFLSTKKLYKKFIFKEMSYQDITDEELERVILKLANEGFTRYFKDRHLIPQNNLVEVRFEDFVKDPVGDLQKIYKHLKIDGFEERIDQFKSFAKKYENYKPDTYMIDDTLKKRIYSSFEQVFKEFNYEK